MLELEEIEQEALSVQDDERKEQFLARKRILSAKAFSLTQLGPGQEKYASMLIDVLMIDLIDSIDLIDLIDMKGGGGVLCSADGTQEGQEGNGETPSLPL